MKILTIAVAALCAASFASPASAAFTVTEGPIDTVVGEIICDGSPACGPRLSGDFTHIFAPTAVSTTLPGGEMSVRVGQIVRGISFNFLNNDEFGYAKVVDGDGLRITIPGDIYTSGVTRISFVFEAGDEQLIDSVIFGNGAGLIQWNNLAIDVNGPVGPPVGGVPEPASWAMMIGGFGLVGTTLRRRRDRLVVA